MASPSTTYNAAGDIRSSSSLAAGASASYNVDFSTKLEGRITVDNTPGGTVAGTSGVRVEFFPRYGSTPADTTTPDVSYTLESIADTLRSRKFRLSTDKYKVTVTNLDASNAVTVAITSDTVDGMS